MTPDPALERFSGNLPIFPLSNVVLFPGQRLPLHIFEPRYREMVADAEQGEGLIGMVLPTEGEDIHSVACLGRMRKLQKLPDGRYLMTLVGLSRVRIERELPQRRLYRVARVELLPDQVRPSETRELRLLAEAVLASFNAILRTLTDVPGSLLSTQRGAPPGLVLDVLASYLPVEVHLKQRLLEELDVKRRGQLLLGIMQGIDGALPAERPRLRLFPKPSQN